MFSTPESVNAVLRALIATMPEKTERAANHDKPDAARQFLTTAAALPLLASNLRAQPTRRPRVAAIYTIFRFRSHAHNILENFLCPFLFNGKRMESPCEIVSFYADQRSPEGDTTDEVARQFKIPVYRTIADALTLGGRELAVDAVLLIGEHGEYSFNRLGQHEYPRKRFFDEIIAVMRRANRYVPIFNDKHLSYRWDWSRQMYDFCAKHRVPFMAGSSVPLAPRPALPWRSRRMRRSRKRFRSTAAASNRMTFTPWKCFNR